MKTVKQHIFYLLLFIFTTSCSSPPATRYIASLAPVSHSCTQSFHNFYFSSFKKSIRPEVGSLAQTNPEILDKLYQIKGLIKTQKIILSDSQELTTQEFFMQLLDQKNLIAQELEDLANRYQSNQFFHDTLLDAVKKIRITEEKRERFLHKITEFANQRYLNEDIYNLNHRYYAGEIASLYGEIGELIAVTMFNKVEKRGGMSYNIFKEIESLHLPQSLLQDIAERSPQDQRNRIKQFLRTKIPTDEYDSDLLDSIIDKEIDIVRQQGHEWIEIKNYKHPLKWEDFTEGHRYHKTAQQAEKMDKALKMLGIRRDITLKQVFLNGVDQETVQNFRQRYGIEIIGNIF